MKHSVYQFRLLTLFLAFLLAPVCASQVQAAGSLAVRAWLEDDNVLVQCDLSRGNPAVEAQVQIRDAVTGRVLTSGLTNARGQFTFRAPGSVREGHGLLISVNAGNGRRAEWKMDASELYSAAALTAGFDASKIASQKIDAMRASASGPLNISAWIEDGDIVAQCDYGLNAPLAGAQIKAQDLRTGKILARGLTNNSGRFTFRAPLFLRDRHPLLLAVLAANGKTYDLVMESARLQSAVPQQAPAAGHSRGRAVGAHAWLENDDIIVECLMANGRPVVDHLIRIQDNVSGKVLSQGHTNNKGLYVFRAPRSIREGHGIDITLTAPDGSMASWSMSASEIYSAASLTAAFDQARIAGREGGLRPEAGAPLAQNAAPAQEGQLNVPLPQQPIVQGEQGQQLLTLEQARAILKPEMDQKIAAIREQMGGQKTDSREMTFVEVIGAIGWLAGFIGLGLFLAARRGKTGGGNK